MNIKVKDKMAAKGITGPVVGDNMDGGGSSEEILNPSYMEAYVEDVLGHVEAGDADSGAKVCEEHYLVNQPGHEATCIVDFVD